MDRIMMGDFNFGDDEPGEEYALNQDYVDSWKILKPSDPGYTFDSEQNHLAALGSDATKRRRLDRVLVR